MAAKEPPFSSAYDFSKMRVIELGQHDTRYTLVGANAQQALNDIAAVCKKEKIRLKLSDVVFTAPDMTASVNSDFTHLTLCKLTSTGKTPAHPLRLYFTTSNDPHRPGNYPGNYYTGEIFYTKTGIVGKYHVNYWKREGAFGHDRIQFKGKLEPAESEVWQNG